MSNSYLVIIIWNDFVNFFTGNAMQEGTQIEANSLPFNEALNK